VNVLVFSCSATLFDTDYFKGILRQVAAKYPNLEVRTDGGTGDAKELTEFCTALWQNVEVFKTDGKGWPKHGPDVRNAEMLRGYRFDPLRLSRPHRDERDWPRPIWVAERADLVLAFQGKAASDNTTDLVKLALRLAMPVQLYKEKWTKKKKWKESEMKGLARVTNHPRNSTKLGPETLLKIDTERKAA
jgi:hypothetical protein